MAVTYKQNDTAPAYQVALKDNYGLQGEAAINLTTATSVKLVMREAGTTGTPKINGTCTITTPASGIVTYSWQTTDLDTVGTFSVEFEILWNDGKKETVPNASYATIIVKDDLSD